MLWLVSALSALTLLSLWAILYQLVRQQGRLLLQLDSLEERFGAVVEPAAPTAAQNGNGAAPQPSLPRGVPVGEAIESFSLLDLEGNEVSLESFRGRRVLLVHWNPSCGFCDLIAPDLAEVAPELRRRGTELVLVSYGDAQANRELAAEHGLECRILLPAEREGLKCFQGLGTPVAYLLDEDGKVAEPLAVGATEVPELVRRAAKSRRKLASERSLGESKIEREGLKAGTLAPAFELPDISGKKISLARYRGRRVLLVFSAPDCGPCSALAPELASLERDHRDNGLDFVMVGRGDPKENRKKAREHGIEFPYVLQDKWKLSKSYGIFTTPVAFLVDEEGVIARDVAVGADQILALAREQVSGKVGV